MGGEIDIMEQINAPLLTPVWGSLRWNRECGKLNWSWLPGPCRHRRARKPMSPNDTRRHRLDPGAAFPGLFCDQIDFSASFHEFGVDWDETSLKYHVDGG